MLLLYGLPTLALILGVVAGMSIFEKESYAFVLGLVFLAISGVVLRIKDSKSGVKSENLNYMVKKL